MKTRLIFLALGCMLVQVWGEPEAPDVLPGFEAFVKVPETKELENSTRLIASANLPKDLAKELKHYEFWDSDTDAFSTEFYIFTYDLNHDGKNEYFVYNRTYSGSGGPCFMIFRAFKNSWRLIAQVQGRILVSTSKKGWPRLVELTRGGSGVVAKTFHEFRNGKYREVSGELYDRGAVSKITPTNTSD